LLVLVNLSSLKVGKILLSHPLTLCN
jgi:hypothetical protein